MAKFVSFGYKYRGQQHGEDDLSLPNLRRLSAFLILPSLLAPLSHAVTRGELLLSNESFLSPQYSATSAKEFSHIGVHLTTDQLSDTFYAEKPGLAVDLESRFTPQASALNYLNVKQLYVRQWGLVVGRMKHNWSELDDQWNLGMVQPLFRGNLLRPEAQGLSGIFLDLRGEPIGLRLFGSFVFVPNQDPGFVLRGGKFEAASPWFNPPPERVEIKPGVEDEVSYILQKPNANDVIFNPSYMAQIYSGNFNDGFYFQATLGYKPINALAIGWTAYQQSKLWYDTVVPLIAYTNLTTADLRYSRWGWSFGVGAFRDNPERPRASGDMNYIAYDVSTGISPYAEWSSDQWKILASWLSISGANTSEFGPWVGLVRFPVQDRYLYKSAAKLSATFKGKASGWRRWKLSGSYLRDPSSGLAVLDGNLNYQIQERWHVYGSTILIDGGSSSGSNQVNFVQNKDLAEVGVSYVF